MAKRKRGHGTVSKVELIAQVAEASGESKASTARIINALQDTIVANLKRHSKVTLRGFGTFDVVHRKGRTGRNPMTGEALKIKAKWLPKFSFSSTVKEKI